MSGGFSASPPVSSSISSPIQSKTQVVRCPNSTSWASLCTVIPRMIPRQHRLFRPADLRVNSNVALRCNCSGRPGGPAPGESDSRNILDAFFLGKALAEALNERVESTVGEFLSTIGRLQAEQLKQVQDFQEEVLERAKQAKEKAAREAMEAQGVITKSSTSAIPVAKDGDAAPVAKDGDAATNGPSTSYPVAPMVDTSAEVNNKDPPVGVSDED